MSTSDVVSGQASPAPFRFAAARRWLPLAIGTLGPFLAGFGYNLGILEPFLLLFYGICWLWGVVAGCLGLYRLRLEGLRVADGVVIALLVTSLVVWPSDGFQWGVIARGRMAGGAEIVAEAQALMAQWRDQKAEWELLVRQKKVAPKDPRYEEFQTGSRKLQGGSDTPPHIASLHPAWVEVTDDRVEIKIAGFGVFEGYVVPRDGSRAGVRVVDGLYWTSHQ